MEQLQRQSDTEESEEELINDIIESTPTILNKQNYSQAKEYSSSDTSSTISDTVQFKIFEPNKENTFHVSQTQFKTYALKTQFKPHTVSSLNNKALITEVVGYKTVNYPTYNAEELSNRNVPLNSTGINLENINFDYPSPTLTPSIIHTKPHHITPTLNTNPQIEITNTNAQAEPSTQIVTTEYITNLVATLSKTISQQITMSQIQTQQNITASQTQMEQNIAALQIQMEQNIAALQIQMEQNTTASQTQMEQNIAISQNTLTKQIEATQSQIRETRDTLTQSQERLEQRQTDSQLILSTGIIEIQRAMEIMSIECKERARIAEEAIKQNRDSIITLEQKTQDLETNIDANKLQIQNNAIQLTNIQLSLQELRTLTNEQPILRTNNSLTARDRLTSDPNRMSMREDIHTTSEDESTDSNNSTRIRTKRRRMSNLRIREPSFNLNNNQTAPEFITEMNDFYARTEVIDDEEKIKNFPNYLRGNAANWGRIQLSIATSWRDLCNKFITQYFNHNEIAQEWEALNYRQYTDCEAFILKAWNLQSTLHTHYSTKKKLANIIRKLPFYLQNRIKERENVDFNDFLKNIKEIEKTNSRFKNYSNYNQQRQNSPPQSPQNRTYYNQQRQNSPPQSPQKRTYNNNFNQQQQTSPQQNRNFNNYNSRPNPSFQNNRYNRYQNSTNRNNNSRPRSRKRRFNTDHRDNRPPYYDNRQKGTQNKPSNTVGAIILTPIANQPGTFKVTSGIENTPLGQAPDQSPGSPKRDRTSRSPSPNSNSMNPNVNC